MEASHFESVESPESAEHIYKPRYFEDAALELSEGAHMIFYDLAYNGMPAWHRESAAYYSLGYVTRLEELLSVRSQDLPDWFHKASQSLSDLLPFTREQRSALAQEFNQHSGDPWEWYRNATPTDMLFLDLWRRWLSETFPDTPLRGKADYQPDAYGRAVLDVVGKLSEIDDYFAD